MTSRDDFLDVLRLGKPPLLTRPTDLRRNWSYIERIALSGKNLVWKCAKPALVPDHYAPGIGVKVFDGNVARHWIAVRQQAEHDGRDMLDEFLALREAADEKILDFANTWGVLELCAHNLPHRHPFSPREVRREAPLILPSAMRSAKPHQQQYPCPAVGREPLETWRFFARQMHALLRIVALLQNERPVNESDWSLLLERPPREGSHPLAVRHVVNAWLHLADVRPRIDTAHGRITWCGSDLFGELAVQMALVSALSPGQVHCTYCGEAYAPKKRVIKNGIHCCPKERCRKLAAAARSARRRREHKTNARKTPFRSVHGGRTDDPLFS